MKTNKHPKTRTIFGVKCKVSDSGTDEAKWTGENKQFLIFIYEIEKMSDDEKKFIIYVELKTFYNITFFGEGNSLKEAQIDLMCKFKKSIDGVKWLRFDMEDKCAFLMPYNVV
jgi:hypothetical protein